MELVKMNFFKKFQDDMPIGLCSLGLKKEKKCIEKFKKIKFYPNFFNISKSILV